MKKQKVSLCVITLVLMTGCANISNLFCKGDFQSYSLTSLWTQARFSVMYDNFLNDSCWFFKNSTKMEINKPSYGNYTQCCQLNTNAPYILCQSVNLTIGELYNFTFQFAFHYVMNTSNVTLTLNNNTINSYFRNRTLFPNKAKIIQIFEATVIKNTFCISSTETWLDSSYVGSATLVDNFQLYLIPRQTVLLNFTISIDYTYGKIYLNSSTNLNLPLFQYFQNLYTLKLDSIIQTNTSFYTDAYGYVCGEITVNETHNVSTIQCAVPGIIQYNNYLWNYSISFTQQNSTIQPYVPPITNLTNNTNNNNYTNIQMLRQIGTKQQFEQNIQKFAKNLSKWIFHTYQSLRLYFCSYFFMNFITFYSLLATYNFLNLNTQPNFSYQTLKYLAFLFYYHDNQIFDSLQTAINQNINVNFNIDFSNFVSNSHEKVAQNMGEYSWFYEMGITSNFIQNNFVNILLVFLTIFKLFFTLCIFKLLQKWIGKWNASLSRCIQIVIIQILIGSADTLISAISNLLSSGSYVFKDQINVFLHVSCLFIVIFLPFLYCLNAYDKYRKRINRIIKIFYDQNYNYFEVQNKLQNLHSKFIWDKSFSFLQYTLYILIPCLATIYNRIGFFIIVSIYLLILLYCFIKGFKFYGCIQKFERLLLLLTLWIHHISFFFMYIVTTIQSNTQFLTRMCWIAGIIVILTVICGGIGQILGSLIELIQFIFKPIYRRVRKSCMKQKEVIQIKKQIIQPRRTKKCNNYFNTNEIYISVTINTNPQKQQTLTKQDQQKKRKNSQNLIQQLPIKTSQDQLRKKKLKIQTSKFNNKKTNIIKIDVII